MIPKRFKLAFECGMAGAALCLCAACKPKADSDSDAVHFAADTVAADEAGEVIVLWSSIEPPSQDGKYKDVIIGGGPNDFGDPVGTLVSLTLGCTGGRPVWVRSALHNPTVVVVASAGSLRARGLDVHASFDDLSVVGCVKKAYSGTFKAGRGRSGTDPWTLDREPFASLYEQMH